MKKEKSLNITNMNGVSTDDDTTCAFNDMNCVESKESTCSFTDMNCTGSDEETTCSFTDMNCTGENK